jgi:hypothetical protein
MSAWQKIPSSNGSQRTLHAVRHAEHSGIHGTAGEAVGQEHGLGERTYADAYPEGLGECRGSDSDANWGAVDGCLLVVLFDDELLCSVVLGGRAGGRGVAVDVGVVGDVREVGTSGH